MQFKKITISHIRIIILLFLEETRVWPVKNNYSIKNNCVRRNLSVYVTFYSCSSLNKPLIEAA